MSLTYKCLIIDHDDTAVNSSKTIHYPAHLEVMRQLRPGEPPVSFEGWMEKNFHPGVMRYYREELGMDDREIREEFLIWQQFTKTTIPSFFPGFLEMLDRFRGEGGIVTVVSHSEVQHIRRDYVENQRDVRSREPLLPEIIFGWEFEETKRKPSPWPVEQILQKYGLKPEDALILDDLKPGVEMGKTSRVSVAGAGWGHNIASIRTYMQENCIEYFTTVTDFADFLFSN